MNRKQRRAEEAKVRKGTVIEAASKSAPMSDKVSAAEKKTVVEMFPGEKLDRAKVAVLIENALVFAAAFNSDEKRVFVACGEGCYHCCYQKVATTGPEVVHIATWMLEHLTAAERAEYVAKLDSIIAERNPTEIQPVRCAFLSEAGACRIYEVRPLACRSVTSASSEPCRKWQEEGAPLGKVADGRRYTSHMATLKGLDHGVTARGLEGGFLDFHSALRSALVDPTVIDRWYAGEHVFGPMTIPPRQQRLLPLL